MTNVTISETDNDAGGLSTLGLDFYVNQTNGVMVEAASIVLNDTDFRFTALATNMTLGVQINTLNVDKITVNSCAYGNLNAKILKTKLNAAFLVVRPIINQILSGHALKVPTHLGKYFVLSDLVIGYYNDYFFIGLTPTFVGPSAETKEWYIKEAQKALPTTFKTVEVDFN